MKKKILITAGASFLLLAGLIAGYLLFFAPVDWRYGIDTADRGIEAGIFPWIGASNPELVIHEYVDYDCPHCPGTHRRLRSIIARHLDKVRLVRHDYARMRCAPNNAQDRFASCELVRAAICASKHVDFWQWNDAVMSSPRYKSDAPLAGYVPAMVAKFKISGDAFDKCMYSKETIDRAQKIYLDVKKNHVNATPTYIVDGKKTTLALIREKVNQL